MASEIHAKLSAFSKNEQWFYYMYVMYLCHIQNNKLTNRFLHLIIS